MTLNFDDGFIAPHRDPLDSPSPDFDWNAVLERLDLDESRAADAFAHSETVVRLLALLLVDAQGCRIHPKSVGLRLLALAWLLNPASFLDSPSLRQLARRCGVSPAALARFTGEVSRQTGIRNRAQRHAWNWKRG